MFDVCANTSERTIFDVSANKSENMHELISLSAWECLRFALINSSAGNQANKLEGRQSG